MTLLSVGSIVRLKSQNITAIGPVISWYGKTIYDAGGNVIGEAVEGIEMYDIIRRDGDRVTYRYWKAIDPGIHAVEKWEHEHPGKWVPLMVYAEPRHE